MALVYMRWHPAFEPDCCLALPTASIAVMTRSAVNAVYANKIAALPEEERASFIAEKREEYKKDIDIYHLASEMVIDGIVHPNNLREELKGRFEMYMSKYQVFTDRKHPVYPV